MEQAVDSKMEKREALRKQYSILCAQVGELNFNIASMKLSLGKLYDDLQKLVEQARELEKPEEEKKDPTLQ